MYSPDYKEFRRLARKGNCVPVYRQLLADTLTPVLAYERIAQSPYAFLFESVERGEHIARYSFAGADPYQVFTYRDGRARIEDAAGKVTEKRAPDPFDVLEKLTGKLRPVKVPGLPPLTGGAIGYLSYDAVRYVEHLPNVPPDALGLPDFCFGFYDSIVIFDHRTRMVKVVANARLSGKSARRAYDEAVARIDELVDRLRRPSVDVADDIAPHGSVGLAFESNFAKGEYEAAVERCKDYIRAGDIFQVVLSQRLKARAEAPPLGVYRALRVVNPSPYNFFLRLGDVSLIGSSPEVMVKVVGDEITLRPIAGTRPRGATEAEDLALEKELLADPKELAEHTMLVDLGRNDVGRVGVYGTVRVDERMVIERYSHVMHIVSNVVGRLRRGATVVDTLRACLPAGTVSGAPKVRAMEILDEMEPVKRCHYAGAVGYIDLFGNMDTCITIRTILMRDGEAIVQAGGGIVADSVPETEYFETLNKAKALLKAIEVAEKIFS